MNLPNLPNQYEPKGPSMKIFWYTCLGFALMVASVTVTEAQVQKYGARPGVRVPNNLTIARAVRDLEFKVKRLEAKVWRLERGR